MDRVYGEPEDSFQGIGEDQPTTRGAWYSRANCLGKDVDFFFENDDTGKFETDRLQYIKRDVCGRCAVWRECLKAAIEENDLDYGIRGGLTPKERRVWRELNQLQNSEEQ